MEHREAQLTKAELTAEIDETYRLGSNGPRFCEAPYVGLAACERMGGHAGEHVTTGLTGRLIGWDA